MLDKTDPQTIRKPLIYIIIMLVLALSIWGIFSKLPFKNYQFDDSAQTIFNPKMDEEPTPTVVASKGELVSINPKLWSGYLENPGIGLQYDQSVYAPIIGETVAYPQREDISWKILNPTEDVYDWSRLDVFLAKAIEEGKQLSFRVYTMRGESFGGHQLPQWVLSNGATLFDNGEPNYHNCTYQEEWGKFVEALRRKYDGNPNIAIIDISGYGAFNEWNWDDANTVWDFAWEKAYLEGTAKPSTMSTLDSQSWRRLIDTFSGGAFRGHSCVNSQGEIETVDYSYSGFQFTQLVMPYAGIRQSTQYMFSKGLDVGFRYDCLGRIERQDLFEKVGNEISEIWKKAPIVFEFCNPMTFPPVEEVLQYAHPSLVHSNSYIWDNQEVVRDLMELVGYRYQLTEFNFYSEITKETPWSIEMLWHNVGYAPSYPKMGQTFDLHIYLSNQDGINLANVQVDLDISQWMPANSIEENSPDNLVLLSVQLPETIISGEYNISVIIIDRRTGLPIQLANEGQNDNGSYSVGKILVIDHY